MQVITNPNPISTSTILFDAGTESNMKEIIDRLEDFMKVNDALGLRATAMLVVVLV